MTGQSTSTGVSALKNLFASAPVVTAPIGIVKIKPSKLDLEKLSGVDRRIAYKEKKKLKADSKLSRNAPKPKDEGRLKRTIFLGGVPLNAMEKHIRAFLDIDPSEIEACYFRSIPAASKFVNDKRAASITQEFNTEAKKTKNAYLVVKDEALVDKYVKKGNMKEMDGFLIRVDREKPNTFSVFDRKRSVYVGGIGSVQNETAVANHFKRAGDVQGVRLIRDSNTNLCKGFGFVLFADRSTVPKCIQMFNKTEFDGREIEVTKALTEEDVKAKLQVKEHKRNPFGSGIPRTVKEKVLKLNARRDASYVARGLKKDQLAKKASEEVAASNNNSSAKESVRAMKRKATEQRVQKSNNSELTKLAGDAEKARNDKVNKPPVKRRKLSDKK